MNVLVTGASGFVGHHLINRLLKANHTVRGLSRTLPQHNRRKDGVEYISGVSVADADTMTPSMFKNVDAIIHLVGIIQEAKGGQTFQRIHVEGTRNVVTKAKNVGFTGHIIYMSAIGSAEDAPSEYSRTKYEAEEIVTMSGLPHTIFRPSLILGRDGEFAAQMEDLVKHGGLPVKLPFPFIPVPGSGENKFQPVDIDDLVGCVVAVLGQETANRSIYEIGGATQVTFNQILAGFARKLGVKKPMLHAPVPLLTIAAAVMEKVMAKPPVTRDQLANLSRDNITSDRAISEIFGIQPLGFEEILLKIYQK